MFIPTLDPTDLSDDEVSLDHKLYHAPSTLSVTHQNSKRSTSKEVP